MKAPLTLPDNAVALQSFEPLRVDYSAPEASGRIGGVQAGFPLWRGVWSLTRMEIDTSDEWRAFSANIRGAIRRFLGRDYARPYPKAYPDGFAGMTRAGGGSFDGTATSWSESTNSDDDQTVTLNGLPANFAMGLGDYIGFSWTATETSVAGLTWHAVVRVIEAKTGNGSGVLANVKVEPPISDAIPASATAYLNEPKCVMALVTDQSDLQPIDVLKSIQGGTFVGIQDIRE
jgi:hypothetical protein